MNRPSATLRQRLRDTAAEAMLDSAEQAMIRKGYDRATMQEIAAAAGCATGTFYLYFKNKEVLFQAIVARHARVLFDAGRAAMEKAEDPLEKLRLSIAAMVRYTMQHKSFFRLFFTAVPLRNRAMDERLSDTARAQRSSYKTMELEILRDAQSRGLIRSDLSAEVLQSFMEAAAQVVVEQFVFASGRTADEEPMSQIWGLITGGIGASRGGQPTS